MLRTMLFRARKDGSFLFLTSITVVFVVFFPLFAGISKLYPINIVVLEVPP